MVSLLAVFAGLTAVYIAVLVYAARVGSERLQPVGPLLMLRTQFGKRLIDKLSRGRAWGWIGDVFIVLTVGAGVLMLVLVVWQNTLLFTHTDIVRERPPRLSETLAIPGINPVIPIGYGLMALIVALVIHEGGHGVLARYAKLPVKSLGLVFLVIPVGAFVEPDETEMLRTRLRNKLRLFAAGPGPNLVLATVCVLLFAQVLAPTLQPANEGVAVMATVDGLPAQQGGLEAGMFLTHIEGRAIATQEAFTEALNRSEAEQPLQVSFWDQGQTGTVTLLPLDRYAYWDEQTQHLSEEERDEVLKEWWRGKPYLGVVVAGPEGLANTRDQFVHPFRELGVRNGALFYIAMPFLNLQPAPQTFHDVYDPQGFWEDREGAFWVTFNSLYWLFWLNVVLGTFNALPLGPLDGGQMFRHTLHWWYRRREGIRTDQLDVIKADDAAMPTYIARDPAVEERLERVELKVSMANKVVGFTLLALVLAPLVVPQFL